MSEDVFRKALDKLYGPDGPNVDDEGRGVQPMIDISQTRYCSHGLRHDDNCVDCDIQERDEEIAKLRVEVGRYQSFVNDVADELDCECEHGDYGQRHGSTCLRCAAIDLVAAADKQTCGQCGSNDFDEQSRCGVSDCAIRADKGQCEHQYECVYEGAESETYQCKHCGDRYKLYDEEMR